MEHSESNMSSEQIFWYNGFVSRMLYDLRIPLNTVIGSAEILLQGIDGSLNAKQETDLIRVSKAGQYAITLLNQASDIMQIDSGCLELQFEEVVLDEVVNSVMEVWPPIEIEYFAPDKIDQFIVNVEVPGNLPTIWGDKVRIKQIIHLLLVDFAIIAHSQELILSATRDEDRIIIFITTNPAISFKFSQMQPLKKYDSVCEQLYNDPHMHYQALYHSLIKLHGGEVRELQYENNYAISFTLPIDR